MEISRQRCIFSVLVMVVVVSAMPFDTSNPLSVRLSKDSTVSLEECLKHLEIQQTDPRVPSMPSRKIFTDDRCSDIVGHFLENFQPLLHHSSDMRSGSRTDNVGAFSRDPVFSISDGDNNQRDKYATGKHGKSAVYHNPIRELSAKEGDPKVKADFNPQNLDDVRSALSEVLSNRNHLKGLDISPLPHDLQSAKSASDFFQRVPPGKSAFKPRENSLGKMVYFENLPEVFHSLNNPKEKFDVDRAHGDDESILYPDDNEASWRELSLPAKRASDNWLNVVSTEVAKRRRQTLSINNALMALTDMVMEHGREKLMRNRDNLRYHMYIQG